MRILTFDIEEWFHILDHDSVSNPASWDEYESRLNENVEKILYLLDDTNQKATFFVLGWIAEKYPDVVKKIKFSGHEIGSHSCYHQLIYEQDKRIFQDDLEKSLSVLEDLTGEKVRYYRAPGFSLTEDCLWAFDVLAENGIEIDCSIFPAGRAHGGFKGFGKAMPARIDTGSGVIKEFPINTVRFFQKNIIFSGGGYFRLFPYFFMRSWFDSEPYIMTYFHPRDFDLGQPVIRGLSTVRKFKAYYGINAAFEKLEKLLNEFEFIDLSEANKRILWESTPVIKV